MLRIANRNSRDDTRLSDLEVLKKDLKRSGQNPAVLDSLEPKALSRFYSTPANNQERDQTSSLVFAVDYFAELPQLKQLVSGLHDDICSLIGPTKITIAARKRRSIGNRVLRNGAICEIPSASVDNWSQKCGAVRCKSCDLMADGGDMFNVNKQTLIVPRNYNCKTSNVIYVAQCTICNQIVLVIHDNQEDTYFGQSFQRMHMRINGHRIKFNETDYKKSALAMHAHDCHPDQFNINIFKFAVIKSCHPLRLNREEFKFIEKFSTNRSGINRCKVQR